jgi:4-amino-4-deoxy-L-arabinose transferase-like glycosyltransferase
MEGESLVQLWRLRGGQVLYVRPTLSYVPMIYQPLYFYLARLVAEIAGSGFVSLRLVSILASVGCAVVIYLLVKRETSRAWCGWTAVGMWLATFYISGACL